MASNTNNTNKNKGRKAKKHQMTEKEKTSKMEKKTISEGLDASWKVGCMEVIQGRRVAQKHELGCHRKR